MEKWNENTASIRVKTTEKGMRKEAEIPEPLELQRDASSTNAEYWKDKYLRLYAQWENTKKRFAKRFETEMEEKTRALVEDMLPLADNLERILEYTEVTEDQDLEKGLKIALEAFQQTLEKYGVRQMEAQGEIFNPEYHEAVGVIPTSDAGEETILKVEQKGYLLDGKVLRPARVLIASR